MCFKTNPDEDTSSLTHSYVCRRCGLHEEIQIYAGRMVPAGTGPFLMAGSVGVHLPGHHAS